MDASLVIMAAGLGSRFGGNKQTASLGPNGEILMEYSVYDAISAGFNKIVFIIKPDMLKRIKNLCGDRIAQRIKVEYVFQDFSSIPSFYTIPPERTKPFGTVHALLCAEEKVQEPFAVLNADDYYGPEAFKIMYDALCGLTQDNQATMVGYRLGNTVSANGSVTRGICMGDGDLLDRIKETKNIMLMNDGTIRNLENNHEMKSNALVSMNFWGFRPAIFKKMHIYFMRFLRDLEPEELKAECLLPIMVDDMIRTGSIQVTIKETESRWFGVTYKADKETVMAQLLHLHQSGIYPPSLRDE